jgi:hypothetical protein
MGVVKSLIVDQTVGVECFADRLLAAVLSFSV